MCTYMYVNMFANMYIIYKSVIACTISLFVSSLSNLPHRLLARQDLRVPPWSPGPSDGLHKGGRFENPKESPRGLSAPYMEICPKCCLTQVEELHI